MKRRELLKAAAALSVVPMLPSLSLATPIYAKDVPTIDLSISALGSYFGYCGSITPAVTVGRNYFGVIGYDSNNKPIDVRRALTSFALEVDGRPFDVSAVETIVKDRAPKSCRLIERRPELTESRRWTLNGDVCFLPVEEGKRTRVTCSSFKELNLALREFKSAGGRLFVFASDQDEDELWTTDNINRLAHHFASLSHHANFDQFILGRPLSEICGKDA